MNSRLTRLLTFTLLILFAPLAASFIASTDVHAQQKKRAARNARAAVQYSCPMHPEVTSKRPGRCPKCGMNLRAVNPDEQAKKAEAVVPMPVESNSKKADETLPAPKIPDTIVYDQDGRKLNFYTDLVKGKTVAINFIFTTCTTICPPLTATFRRVQQSLEENAASDVQLISISVDPATDVPERLKSFADKFKVGPNWKFITGSKPEIDELLRALGGFVPDKNDHTPLILIGNDTAKFWTRTYGLAPAMQITNLVREAAGKSKTLTSHSGSETESKKELADAASKYFPNLELLTQDNKPVHFYEDLLKGKVVLINFMFTTCKGVCSPMTANLAKVQKYLGERVGKDVFMLSISVDPETDVPQTLKKYADSFHAQPGWYFLTGEKKNVDTVLAKIGGYVADKQQHSSVLIIGNVPTGEWVKMHAMANPTEIADMVVKMIDGKQE